MEILPGHVILAEESGAGKGDSEYRWIIDPWTEHQLRARRARVFRFHSGVARNETVAAWSSIRRTGNVLGRQGEGAFLNGSKIRVSEKKALGTLSRVRISVAVENSTLNCISIRSVSCFPNPRRETDGSAAIDLSYTACGDSTDSGR